MSLRNNNLASTTAYQQVDDHDGMSLPLVRHCADAADHASTTRPLGEQHHGSQHATDEVFNSVSNLSAAMLSLLGTVLLIVHSGGSAWKIISFIMYGLSSVFMFVCSALRHAISSTEKVETKLRTLDNMAIYPFVAGTFTPFCLVLFHKSVAGWSLFAFSWTLAVLGMVLTAAMGPERVPKWITMTMNVTIGWLGLILSVWLLPEIGLNGSWIFILGGAAYFTGGYVHRAEEPNPMPGKYGYREIRHTAVILGAMFHFAVMYFYVAPWKAVV
eukprot:CAMPEP_0172580568 /NCGR_PEP_ID=MMETSP1067-20121228/139825_1 /TAXON_ID=265564 ORGANISM="Thalassiosira punctigera, Strain Tpunct2005C2" /NCGR_SAMPLE_ID=MMETSP1067 /ASSEMBLY_ACC=CAM_ASM_000444 /LENGTH=271 /DNA_ID=CAMNT_0013373313 /DNA_START=42 /DNA_END=857 /DNA_ORIENTATION=-